MPRKRSIRTPGWCESLRRPAAGDGQHDTAHPYERGEGDDEGAHLQLDDEDAVEKSDWLNDSEHGSGIILANKIHP